MGGTGSGLSGGRPTVESCYTLDINELRRCGVLSPGRNLGSSYTWTNSRTGAIFKVAVLTLMEDVEDPRLILVHRGQSGEDIRYTVELTSSAQRLGGRRWWFRCPLYSERVAKLHLPRGADRFACREAYRLGYHTQRASPRYRAILRCHAIRRSLGADTNPCVPVEKPHRMRWEMFDRKLAQLAEADMSSAALSWPMVDRMRASLRI